MRKRVGVWVRLKQPERAGYQKAQIVEEYPFGYTRGQVRLSRPMAGFLYWNKSDLVACDPPKHKPK